MPAKQTPAAATQADAFVEPVGELKFGQVGIANLRVKRLDPEALEQELAAKIASAPKLFERAPVVLDISHLSRMPDIDAVRSLLQHIKQAGLLPVGLAYGTRECEDMARTLDLPLFAKFRNAYERAPVEPVPQTSVAVDEPMPPPRGRAAASASAPKMTNVETLRVDKPVRSGQQVYARGGDLVVTHPVANGAEVIADGSVHIYGPLRGRALAGAQGNERARIYCREFYAELVSIAGHYRVFEDIPADLLGQSVQAWLEGEKLLLARLA
ncbi:MAG: septum site-determining protein MinC [Dokdonella sp.]